MTELTKKADWIEWSGGECPVGAYTFVATKHRGGKVCEGAPALHWVDRWSDGWAHKGPDRRDDIIAYRFVKP